MRVRHLRVLIPTAAAAAIAAAAVTTEAMHVRHLKGHAQAALDETVAEVALRRRDPSALEEAIRARGPGDVARATVVPTSDRQTIAVVELTLPSAWPMVNTTGYRQVITSKVTVQPPGG